MDCPKCGVGKLNEVELAFHELADMPTQKGLLTAKLKTDQCFVCNGI